MAAMYVPPNTTSLVVLLPEAEAMLPGAQLGRHLQPAAGEHFSLRPSRQAAEERYEWWPDGLRHGSCVSMRRSYPIEMAVAVWRFVLVSMLLHNRPAGVMFQVELSAEGLRVFQRDGLLTVVGRDGWLRFSGSLRVGTTCDVNEVVLMTVTAV